MDILYLCACVCVCVRALFTSPVLLVLYGEQCAFCLGNNRGTCVQTISLFHSVQITHYTYAISCVSVRTTCPIKFTCHCPSYSIAHVTQHCPTLHTHTHTGLCPAADSMKKARYVPYDCPDAWISLPHVLCLYEIYKLSVVESMLKYINL